MPGLAAKAIIDVLLRAADVEDEDRYIPPLVDAGCQVGVRKPGHHMLRTRELEVHVHVYSNDDPRAADDLRLLTTSAPTPPTTACAKRADWLRSA